jgi:RNA polymerase sigma-70 factor (ECF subfamily)
VQRVDASDVLQEGFLDASNRLDEYLAKPTMPFFVWLRFLVGQRLLAVHRWHFERQKRDPRREDVARCHPIMETDVIANEFSGAFTSPSHAAAKADLAVQIRKLLDAMDETDREILVLRHFEELSNNETAAELGLSKAATSKRYIRALTRLKETVSETLGEGL